MDRRCSMRHFHGACKSRRLVFCILFWVRKCDSRVFVWRNLEFGRNGVTIIIEGNSYQLYYKVLACEMQQFSCAV